jgi:hypothetical protein
MEVLRFSEPRRANKRTEKERRTTATKLKREGASDAGGGAGRGCLCCRPSDDSRRLQERTAAMIDDVLCKVTAADCNI